MSNEKDVVVRLPHLEGCRRIKRYNIGGNSKQGLEKGKKSGGKKKGQYIPQKPFSEEIKGKKKGQGAKTAGPEGTNS